MELTWLCRYVIITWDDKERFSEYACLSSRTRKAFVAWKQNPTWGGVASHCQSDRSTVLRPWALANCEMSGGIVSNSCVIVGVGIYHGELEKGRWNWLEARTQDERMCQAELTSVGLLFAVFLLQPRVFSQSDQDSGFHRSKKRFTFRFNLVAQPLPVQHLHVGIDHHRGKSPTIVCLLVLCTSMNRN